ncbi:hypothetical protein AB0862_033745 [Acinetobacter baumannii]
MSAVPPAAPAPAPTKTLGGKFQKEGIAATIPAPNKASEMTTTTGFASKKPAVKKPIAPKESKPAVNFKRSPDLSAKRVVLVLPLFCRWRIGLSQPIFLSNYTTLFVVMK